VTMRSDYWGQGGHNAVLLVGDFFRDALKLKLIDVKAKFPQPKRPPPLMVEAPSDNWTDQSGNMNMLPPGYGVISRGDGDTSVVIGPDGTQTTVGRNDSMSVAADDPLGRFLIGLERSKEMTARNGVSSGGSANMGEARSGTYSDGQR